MNKKKKQTIGFILGIIFGLILIISLIILLVKISSILPNKYLIPLIIFLIVICLIILFFMFYKKSKLGLKIFLYIICLLISGASLVGIKYFNKTEKFLNDIMSKNIKLEHFYVIVKSDSNYHNLLDLEDDVIGYNESEVISIDKAVDYLKGQVDYFSDNYTDLNALLENFNNGKVNAILASESIEDYLTDNFKDTFKILYEFDIEKEENYTLKSVNTADEPFSILISGIDTDGPIANVARSDVNIIVTVNPKTHKILLIHIPRDFYVQLHGTTGIKDKLTHAGYYGVDMSVNTIQDFMGIELNYYVRVNFSTLIQVIDILGGVDVYSDLEFIPYHGKQCYFYVGMNHMDSACALAFARERYSYVTGDRHRGENQMAVITAIINKALSKELLLNYDSLLSSLSGSFQTNISSSDIYKLVKLQLQDMPKWDIKSMSLNGYDDMNYTYSHSSMYTYVMIPYQKTIDDAVLEINNIKSGN